MASQGGSCRSGTLRDGEIRELAKSGNLISAEFDPECVHQACYELRAGNVYYDLSNLPEVPRHELREGEQILVKPKQLVAIITKEALELPPDILGRVLTKGRLFSVGMLPINTYADPGFRGNLGLVMYNLSSNYLQIRPGEPIAKIEFSRLEEPVEDPYSGQHGYQTKIWPIATDMVVRPEDALKDHRVGPLLDEVKRECGPLMGRVLERVFRYERRLITATAVYLVMTLVLVGVIGGTNWLSTTLAVLLGVGANLATGLLLFLATSLGGRCGGSE